MAYVQAARHAQRNCCARAVVGNPPLTLVLKSVTFSLGRTKRSSSTLPALFTTHTLQGTPCHEALCTLAVAGRFTARGCLLLHALHLSHAASIHLQAAAGPAACNHLASAERSPSGPTPTISQSRATTWNRRFSAELGLGISEQLAG